MEAYEAPTPTQEEAYLENDVKNLSYAEVLDAILSHDDIDCLGVDLHFYLQQY